MAKLRKADKRAEQLSRVERLEAAPAPDIEARFTRIAEKLESALRGQIEDTPAPQPSWQEIHAAKQAERAALYREMASKAAAPVELDINKLLDTSEAIADQNWFRGPDSIAMLVRKAIPGAFARQIDAQLEQARATRLNESGIC